MKSQAKTTTSKMMKFDGLYEDRITRPDADYLFTELLETRSEKFGWDIKPHIHPDLLQVFFITKGEFDFFDAERKIRLKGPCLLIIPSTALHGFIFNDSVAGHILTITESYYENVIMEIQVLAARADQIIQISEFNDMYSPWRIGSMIETIDQELAIHEPGKKLMLQACLQQLFLVIHRLAQLNAKEPEELNNPAKRYYRRFQQLIRKTGGITTVTKLASELAVSSVHLNRICKQISGKSAGQLLQEYLIGEAKKYLTYTSYSVSEIAFILHFEYPNYFARFFRKHTGLSPKEFREANSGRTLK